MSLVRQQRKHAGTEHTFEKVDEIGKLRYSDGTAVFWCAAASLRRSACSVRMEVW